MAKKRTTVKHGPSRRPKKRSRNHFQSKQTENEGLKKAFVEIGDNKGLGSQDRFERIFTGNFYKPYWFLGIRRANKHEDHNEGTDFFVITRDCGEIRFDVKSSFYHLEMQKEEQKNRLIFVWGIVIRPHISDDDIRRAVFKKCEIHIARLKKKVLSGNSQTRTP
jgi:hypothetical protein